MYFGKGEIKVCGYVDADFAGDIDHRRSTTDYICIVDIGAVSWISWNIVVLSTTKVEYVAVIEAAKNWYGLKDC